MRKKWGSVWAGELERKFSRSIAQRAVGAQVQLRDPLCNAAAAAQYRGELEYGGWRWRALEPRTSGESKRGGGEVGIARGHHVYRLDTDGHEHRREAAGARLRRGERWGIFALVGREAWFRWIQAPRLTEPLVVRVSAALSR